MSITAQAAEVGRAPPVPPWPAGLPDAEDRDGGTFLRKDLADAVAMRLFFLDEYERLCQSSLDEQASIMRTDRELAVKLERSRALAESVSKEQSGGWPLYQVVLAIGGALAGGLVVGYVAGAVHL